MRREASDAFVAVLLACVLISLCVGQNGCRKTCCVLAVATGSSSVVVHYIDVGQGDYILVDTTNRDVLIDGGPHQAASTVLSYRDDLGITRIHLMIATHVHADHIGGLIGVLDSTVEVDEILINNQTYDSSTYTEFMSSAQSHTVTVAERGQTFILTETVNLTVLNPVQPLEFASANDNSIVVKLQVDNTSFLFTGDAEADAEQSMINVGIDVQCDILKVGHHGSRYATTQLFLDNCAASYAVISVGEDNPYDHPHAETVERLLANDVTVYGTFHSGTIIASTDGDSVILEGNPEPIPEFPSNLIISTLMVLTLLGTITLKRRRKAETNSSYD